MQNIDDIIIELPEYNEKIKQQFKATSEFIRNLPLTREQNDELVYRLADDVRAAREDGFACAICNLIEKEAPTDESNDTKAEHLNNGLRKYASKVKAHVLAEKDCTLDEALEILDVAMDPMDIFDLAFYLGYGKAMGIPETEGSYQA